MANGTHRDSTSLATGGRDVENVPARSAASSRQALSKLLPTGGNNLAKALPQRNSAAHPPGAAERLSARAAAR